MFAQVPATTATAEVKPGPNGDATLGKPDVPESKGPIKEPVPADDGEMDPNIPQQPSMGEIQAALRPGMTAARKCVAGAGPDDEVSRVSITFGSDGYVKSVTVTGWAEANGKAECIKSALQRAFVGPFWKPSISMTYAVRP